MDAITTRSYFLGPPSIGVIAYCRPFPNIFSNLFLRPLWGLSWTTEVYGNKELKQGCFSTHHLNPGQCTSLDCIACARQSRLAGKHDNVLSFFILYKNIKNMATQE